MRIPRGLVHKSSQTYQRSQLLPLHSAVHERSKRSPGDNQAAVRTPPSRPQTSSPAYSSSTFNTYRKESVDSLLRPPEAYQKKHVSETQKNKTMVHERPNGVHSQAEDVSSLRPHVGGEMGVGYGQQGLTENSPEGRTCAQEQVNCSREMQNKGNCEQKSRKTENIELLKAENSLKNRVSCPANGHNPDLHADTKNASHDANHGLSAKGKTGRTCCNLDLADENVYINPQTIKEYQGESSKETSKEPLRVGLTKEKMAEGDFAKSGVKNDSETQFFDVSTQKTAYFDVATQMSPADAHRLPSGGPQGKPLFVTERTSGLAEKRSERGIVDSIASPLARLLTSNPMATCNMFIPEQYEITKTQLCEYGSTGDHSGRQGGFLHDALHTRHKHGNTGGSPTSTVRNEAHNTTRYNKNVYADPGAKGEDQTSYQADSLIFDSESLMPPPPYGYHVRRNYSNPDSTTNVCKIMQFDSVGNDPNGMGLLNSNDLFASRKAVTACETDKSTSSSSEVWQSLVNNQPPRRAALPSGREHPVFRRIDTERKKHPRKLMIIGKVKCSKKNIAKQSARTHLEMMREDDYDIFGKINEAKRDSRHHTVRRVVPMVIKTARKTSEPGGRYTENLSPLITKIYPSPGAYVSLDDGSKYCKISEYTEKHTHHLHTKRKRRHRSAMKINGGINIKRVNLKEESGDCRKSLKRLTKTTESQSCLNVAPESNHNFPEGKRGYALQNGQLELLPSYYMNLNSNAGISDQNSERISGGKSQAETASVENTHSTDQYISVHGDSEVHEIPSELDSNLSPSLANEGKDVISVISLGRCEPVVNVSTSNDHLKPGGLGTEADAQQKAHTFSDSERSQKKFQEKANSEKSVDFRGDSHFTRSTASLTLKDPYINTTPSGRHKRKAKTTETAVIKKENSISKNTSTTVASKEWRKLAIYKPKQEKQKQQVTSGDVYKTIAGAVDKSNKPVVEIQRVVRTGKGSGSYGETFETKIKTKCSYEPYLDYIAYKESPRHGRACQNIQGQGVKCTESDHHYSPMGIASRTSSKGEDVSHIKRLVSLPETMPSQSSPKKTSLSAQYQIKTAVAESVSLAESKSPTILSTGESSTTPVSLKQETPCSPLKLGVIGKRDAVKTVDSPKKDSTDSPKKEIPVFARKDLNNVQDINEDAQQTPMQNASAVEDTDQTVVSQICQETKFLVESPNAVQSTEAKKDHVSRTRDSPSQKYVDTPFKHSNKKTVTDNQKVKIVEYVTTKDSQGEFSNGRVCTHTNLSSKRKSVSRYKTHSRSPDGKRKKRNLKRIITEAEDIKFEKPKKLKNGEKLTEKKRKRRKCKLKAANDLEGKAQSIGATELVYKSRSRSHECNQIAETTLCSVPMENALDIAISEPSLAFSLHYKKKKESRSASSTGRLISSGQVIHSFTKQRIFKYEDMKLRGAVTSSAETTSSMSGSNIPIMSAESLLPFPSTITKTPTKAVQLLPFPKIKKNEKDLQEAELGWNSTFSSDEKAATEKVKQNQKRTMVRYYIVKPKPKKTEREVGVSKLKRPVARLNPDGDDVGSGSEIDLSTEAVPPERIKPGQGKSVQFSDNIEDLEASKEEATNERPLRRPDSESILHHPITKAAIESIKAPGKTTDPDIAATVKILPQKKEEQRSPVLAPRKRRPVWLKKSAKDKDAAAVVKSNETVKSAVGVAVKKLHSSDNILKASSRLNVHFYYPAKATVGSPKISNTSLIDKRKVTYKAWINSIFMAAPMNKATKKVVAKAGSPVDIKEIIEGSSVDAADHFKISKPLHDADVRSARSVPSLAPAKPGGIDLNGGKKQKSSDDSRLVSQKKSKDRPRECWSPRSHSTAESKEQQITAMKSSHGAVDGPTSPAASSNVDLVAAFKQKNGLHRIGDFGNRRRKDKKGGKKVLGESGAKWQALASQEGRNVSDLERVHYCGDVMELNVINMGLAWVVQSVFNKLPFLNQRQHDSASISTSDLATNQQLVE